MDDNHNIIILILSGLLAVLTITAVCLWTENKKQASEISDLNNALLEVGDQHYQALETIMDVYVTAPVSSEFRDNADILTTNTLLMIDIARTLKSTNKEDVTIEYITELKDKIDTLHNDVQQRTNNISPSNLSEVNYILSCYTKIQKAMDEYDADYAVAESTIDETIDSDIRPEFKKAMDEYEAYFDKYAEVMESGDYNMTSASELLRQYKKTMESFEAWENKDLNDAETAYYTEVSLRISSKLLGQ